MVFTNLTPFTPAMTPITNISPLTYRDASTFLEYLETIKEFINETLVPDSNAMIANAIAEYQSAKDSWDTNYREIMDNLAAQIAVLNESAVTGLINVGTAHVAIVALIDAQIADTVAAVAAETTARENAVTAETAARVQAVTDEAATRDAQIKALPGGYMVATFLANGVDGEKLSLFYSPDGKTVTGGATNPSYTPADGQGVRDPSLMRANGAWYVAHTSNNGIDKDFQIATSVSGAPGTWNLLVTVNGSTVPGMVKLWAPQFVSAPDGTYIFFSSIDAANNGSMWWIKATNAALTAWTAPVRLQWTVEPGHYIDGVPVLHTDGKWYLFYSTGNDIERATATTLTGVWTRDKTGNWAGWGTGIEGPDIVKDGATYRAYFDRFTAGTGIAYSESTDLVTWTPPQNLTVVPGTLRNGQAIRHGSFYKITDPVAGLQAQAGQMPRNRVRHCELVSTPGVSGGNRVTVTMTGWAVDDNETTDNSFVSYDPATGFLTFNEYGVYALLGNTGTTGVTGVTRSYAQLTSVDGPFTVHSRTPGGAEDIWSLIIPNFKTNHVGERLKVQVFADWSGAETNSTYPMRLRITKLQ